MLNMGADPNKVKAVGKSPLICAAMYSRYYTDIKVGVAEHCVRRLLDANADKDAQDEQVMTALVYAAANNYPDIVTMLLEAGTDNTLVSNTGRTALQFAETLGHVEVAALLRE